MTKKTTRGASASSGPAPKPTRSYGVTPARPVAPGSQAVRRAAPTTEAGMAAERRQRIAEVEAAKRGEDEPGQDGGGEMEAAAPRRVRARPSDELLRRRRERKERGVVDHGFDKRLGLDERVLDHNNYVYYWATQDMVPRLTEREYEVVPKDDVKGQEVARHSGPDRDAKPQQSILMRKWKQWDEEDRQERLSVNREQDKALLRGNAAALKGDGQGGADYVPEDGKGRPINSMTIEERTH